ncbi:MAG: hypothetical protein AseanaTS_30160 [Candidatus Pelagadaptatus aseana]|uniref:hypothetical protein n=1 Tax=Candidatus Pelagadaptatus aseana TaxID=3120508 RepID=UPI0039B215C6
MNFSELEKDCDHQVKALEASVRELTERFRDLDISVFNHELEGKVANLEMHLNELLEKSAQQQADVLEVQLKQGFLEDSLNKVVAKEDFDPILHLLNGAIADMRHGFEGETEGLPADRR